MNRYPTPGDYQEALQVPEVAFTDPELQRATPEVNTLGLPRAITGAFAAVFPLHHQGQRWAVKCFLTDVEDQRTRYRAIADHLEEAHLPYAVPFDYQPKGVRVDGRTFPIVKMAWVPGQSLYQFVEEHHDQSARLRKLAGAWAQMLADLRAAEIAHGDLQHGNVLISTSEEEIHLHLVDYDTMWVPDLKGRSSAEVGHRNFQHPDRSEQDFGPYLDHFPGLIIYTALLACAERSSLWHRFATGENLLFRASDFYDPACSPLMDELDDLRTLGDLPEVLRTACYLEPAAVPPLGEVLDGASGSAMQAGLGRARRSITETLQREARSRTDDHHPAPWFLPAGLGMMAAAGVAGWLVTVYAAVAVALVGLGLLAGWALITHRALPVVQRRRRLKQELRYFDQLISTYRSEIAQAETQREEILDSVEERRANRLDELQQQALYDKLKYHFINEARQVEGITHKVIVRLKADSIRTAYDLTKERLNRLHQVGNKSTARLLMWRSTLEAQYAEAIPEKLSPAEQRRFDRMIQKRVSHLKQEMKRLRDKIEVQAAEREEVAERLQQQGAYGLSDFLTYLVRLGPAPPSVRGQPSAPKAVPVEPSGLPGAAKEESDPEETVSIDPDASWWQQHRES